MLFAQLRTEEEENPGHLVYEADGWDGYTADRTAILTHLRDRAIPNPVVLSGDIHAHAATDLKTDFSDPSSPVIATELVAGAISSPSFDTTLGAVANNPHLRFASERNGYTWVNLNPERLSAEVRSMYPPDGIRHVTPDSDCHVEARIEVLDGRAGALCRAVRR